MPAPEIAVAYVSIVPSLGGFQRDLRSQVMPDVQRVGGEAGGGFADGFKAKAMLGAAAIGAGFAKLMGDSLEQANITSTLGASLGATGKDAAKYGKVAGKLLASGVVDNFQEGADAIRAVVNGGLVPPDATNAQLQSIATKMADVSKVFGTDLSMQTQAVSALMKNGLAPSADAALDVITTGMQKLGPNAEDLLETFQEYPVQLRKLGLDSKTSLGLFSQGLKAGARDTDIIADAFKEFSIRAIDGSTGTAAGFKALGLDAGKMASQIAKGGKSASAGLDLTLDKLRSIKDPVKQSAAATALFGTQAEDLGKALFALDPSKAVDAVGKVGGSAKRMGDTIRSGPQYEFQTFVKTMQQDLVQALVDYAIPVLMDVVTVVKDIAKWAPGAFAWVKSVTPWVLPLAVAIGGLTLALNAQAIATGIVTGIMTVYRTAMVTGTAVTNGMAAAVALMNAVMDLNPFVLVAIAIAAFVAAIIVAYNKVGWFRALVDTAFRAIGAVVSWLWTSIIKPVFGFISTAARILLTVLTIVVLGPIYLAVKALGAVFRWLYANAVKPSLSAIATVARWLWNNAISPMASAMMTGIRTLGGVFKWLYANAISPAMHAVADVAKWVWEKGVKPSFDLLKKGVKAAGDAFTTAKDIIGKQWKKLEGIAKAPIKFIIDTVYNHGIVAVWNKVAGAFGAPKLHTLKFASGGVMPGYTPGRDPHKFYSPSGGALELSGGEAIMRPEFTRAVGTGFVNKFNHLAKTGGVGAVRNALSGSTQAFKDGGVFGWIKSAGSAVAGVGSDAWSLAKKGASWIGDTLEASARAGVKKIVDPLIAQIPGTSTGFGKMAKGIPMKIVDSIFGYSKAADKKLTPKVNYSPSRGVEQWRPVVLRALHEVGQSSSLANSTLRRMQQESGGNPNIVNKWDSNWKAGHPSVGLMQVIRGTFQHYAGKYRSKGPFSYGVSVDPMANIVSSMRYAMSAYGSLHSAYDRKGGYDSGGWLQPGATLAVNKTGKPEAILTSEQWGAVSALAGGGLGTVGRSGPAVHIQNYNANGMSAAEVATELQWKLRSRG